MEDATEGISGEAGRYFFAQTKPCIHRDIHRKPPVVLSWCLPFRFAPDVDPSFLFLFYLRVLCSGLSCSVRHMLRKLSHHR
ncbi:hypothetical protein B0H12DRAFT_1112984 [Mycena haematopus]|nr:hypothetical protein B0H12DRAFT_1112984 [Mycena haematopus]